jgi:hypothetical protein
MQSPGQNRSGASTPDSSDLEIDRLIEWALSGTGRPPARRKLDWEGYRIHDHGQISRMNLPHNWVEGRTQAAVSGTSFFKAFHPADQPEAMLCLFYRGTRLGRRDAQSFRQLLGQQYHLLMPEEIRAVATTMRHMGRPEQFKIHEAQTQNWNGRSVLTVAGLYMHLQHLAFAIFVDSDGTGTAVQEIYFQAPKKLYLLYFQEAREALSSIVWK